MLEQNESFEQFPRSTRADRALAQGEEAVRLRASRDCDGAAASGAIADLLVLLSPTSRSWT